MNTKKASKESIRPHVRASVSFPAEDYEKLEVLAQQKRVSLAWVVREAVRDYLQGKQNFSKETGYDKDS